MNGETLFIIPGFKEKISDKQYIALRKMFIEKGLDVKMVPIVWDRRVMTDWIMQFHEFFEKNRGKKNAVLGFSWGAMIALITAKDTRPDRLILCSLSPYFAEDLSKIPERWKRCIGHRRVADFAKYSMQNAVKGLSSKVKIFIGGVEQKKFPQLAVRCASAAKALSATVTVAEGVKHDIGDKRYREMLNREIVTLL